MYLSQSSLSKEEQEVYTRLAKYREAFSLRDEIGTCPNIEVDLQDTDISPFFIRPFHGKEEDKSMIDKNSKVGIFRHFETGHATVFFPHYADC